MTHVEKLAAIRGLMAQQRIDAYIIPSADPHISEYLPARYQCIAWTSGFTGSAGTLVITADFAGLWTDSRYFVQATEQLAGSGIELVRLRAQGASEYADWLAERLAPGSTVAFDGNLAAVLVAKTVSEKLSPLGIAIRGDVDLLGALWPDRPLLPTAPAYLLDVAFTGEPTDAKLERLRQEMKRQHVQAHFISSLDDIAWLFNIRGNDVDCNPVVLGFALVTATSATLFIEGSKLSAADQQVLMDQGVTLAGYEEAYSALSALPVGSRLLLDPKRTCFAIYQQPAAGVSIIEQVNPTTSFKAVKNSVEIAHTRDTMIKDGIALTRFFKWLEESIEKEHLTERSIAEKLLDFRQAQDGFVGESFDTIAGYRAHGALPHYKATTASDSILKAEGLLLLDSGGQYRTGTTDITRVISLGNPTETEKADYTLVLKGMIEGSTAIFPSGSRGYQIDAITRKPLWDTLRNYGHGTGHGVGFFLNVHEGPHVFNPSNVDVAIEPGMITSIEPGLYREGLYGIRIENLVLSVGHDDSEFGSFMAFETLTLCYIETSLIEISLLERTHIDWINSYHTMVYERLASHLNGDERRWLAGKTAAI